MNGRVVDQVAQENRVAMLDAHCLGKIISLTLHQNEHVVKAAAVCLSVLSETGRACILVVIAN